MPSLPARCVPIGLERTDDACRPAFGDFQTAGSRALSLARANRVDPAHGGAVAKIRGDKWRERRRLEADWERAHGRTDPDTFRQKILPGLQGLTPRQLVDATGLTRAYCSAILQGTVVPHPRHWEALTVLGQPS